MQYMQVSIQQNRAPAICPLYARFPTGKNMVKVICIPSSQNKKYIMQQLSPCPVQSDGLRLDSNITPRGVSALQYVSQLDNLNMTL